MKTLLAAIPSKIHNCIKLTRI